MAVCTRAVRARALRACAVLAAIITSPTLAFEGACPVLDATGTVTCGSIPFESCDAGVPLWAVWRVFDARTVTVNAEDLGSIGVKYRSVDSSLLAAVPAAINAIRGLPHAPPTYEDPLFGCPPPWTRDKKCVVRLSPFGEACVLVEPAEWRRAGRLLVELPSGDTATATWATAAARRDARAAAVIVAVSLHRAAAALSQSAGLHYSLGVSFGLLFSAALVGCCFFAIFFSTPTKRRVAFTMSFLGYSAAVCRYARSAALSAVSAYPRVAATYCALAVGGSVLGTRAVRSTVLFFDFVFFVCRAAAARRTGVASRASRRRDASAAPRRFGGAAALR